MHIDLNSCFASIEQQANPTLRGIPTVVAAYPTGGGCVLAASIEAKKLGIKTGWRVRDAQKVCPQVAVLIPDPAKYRHVHKEMMKIFEAYCGNVTPKSIDEAVLTFGKPERRAWFAANVEGEPSVFGLTEDSLSESQTMPELGNIGKQIKKDIKEKIGEWLTVSIGIGPNRFMAKTAAGLQKPDGLEEINFMNVDRIFSGLKVEDLCGINVALKSRLNAAGIYSALEFLNANRYTLNAVFRSISSYHWYMRLRGFEVDNWSTERKSIGHSYALPKATNDERELGKILFRLCEKVGLRLRNNNLEAQGVYLFCSYKGRTCFHKSHKLHQKIFTTPEIYQQGLRILSESLKMVNSIGTLAVGVFDLSQSLYQQQTFFEDQDKKRHLAQTLDKINNKYGNFSVSFGTTFGLSKKILDRIAFGGIRDM
ncbi:MAG: hypothetical protein M1352_02610 [Patescibacteria group bacterium]|nr:hypothetical protein [Patescibacteria group bacterium]